MNLSRRYLIKSSALMTGGLAITLLESCIGTRLAPKNKITGEDGPFIPNIWLEIHTNGTIHFILDKVEMGQSVYTSLAMAIAEELDIDLRTLTISFAPADRKYGNPKLMGLQMTGGSTSIPTSLEPLRKAGATARYLLKAAAAKRWGVPEASCQTHGAMVIHQESGRQASYGSLAHEAALLPIPNDVPLKTKDQWRYLGKPHTRLDGILKVQGQATFGIDIQLEQSLVAILVRPPTLGAEVAQFDASKAEKTLGVKKIFALAGGIAVVAEKYYQARKASQLLEIQWKEGALASFSTEAFMSELSERASKMLEKAFPPSSSKDQNSEVLVEGTYETPFLAHATLEPQNCTVSVSSDTVKIWAPTQAPGLLQHFAAKILGLPMEKVHVVQTFLGGGFGRRLAQDYGVEAVLIAKHLHESMKFTGPVKLMWSREDDTRHDFYRPAMVHKLKASVAASEPKRIRHWAHGSSGPSILGNSLPTWIPALVPSWLPQFLTEELQDLSAKIITDWKLFPDPTSIEGAATVPYRAEEHTHHYDAHNPGVPVGFWRSVGHSHTCFAVESFIDEIAHKVGMDPVDYRMDLLRDQPRHLEVLTALRKLCQWDTPRTGFLGVALHESFGSLVGEAAEVEIHGQEIRVTNFWVVIDCGLAVNPLHVEAQMMGSVIFGMTAALFGEITYQKGAVVQGSFDDYPLLRYDQTPRIHVEIMKNNRDPSGVGEPGVPPVAPAIANAIFRATGKRLRRLPLRLAPA